MSTAPSDGEQARGSGAGSSDLPRAIDKDGRATLFAFRARMQEGREAMLAYLETLGSGPRGFAERLHACLTSTDQRVVLGALKLSAQLREWLGGEAPTEDPNRPRGLLVMTPEDLKRLLGVAESRENVVDALEVLVTSAPAQTNGKAA